MSEIAYEKIRQDLKTYSFENGKAKEDSEGEWVKKKDALDAITKTIDAAYSEGYDEAKKDIMKDMEEVLKT